MKFLHRQKRLIIMSMICPFVPGCALGTLGPPPPIPPALFSIGTLWIMIGLLAVSIVFLWKNLNSTKITKTDDLTKILNDINKRLSSIEKEMDKLKRDNK